MSAHGDHGDHENVAPLIPWLANGTLDPVEREQVEGHATTCAPCGALLEQARLQAGSSSPRQMLAHVHPALLTGYEEDPGRLEPETRAWVEGTLADCATCRESYDLLRGVSGSLAAAERAADRAAADRIPERVAAPPARRPWSAAAQGSWFSLFLRPSFALAYLVLLLVLVPVLWREPVDPGAASPRLLVTGGDRITRAPGDAGPTPLVIEAGGPVLLQLRTDLVADDLADPGLSFTLEVLRGGSVRWSAPAPSSGFALQDGKAVASLLLYPERWAPGELHEVALRAHQPGAPLDGQLLFRKSFRVSE